MSELTPQKVIERFRKAKDRRSTWESHWRECYDYALPQRGGTDDWSVPGAKRTDKIFDGTAPDAIDQLAASLLSELTPPWSRWFGLSVGPEVEEGERGVLAPELEKAENALQSHFDQSNFAVEIHQCLLDLVTVGTASLLFEEAPPGEASAFRFSAVPLFQVVLEEGGRGLLDTSFRRCELTLPQLRTRFPDAKLPDDTVERLDKDIEAKAAVIEAVVPEGTSFSYLAVLETESTNLSDPLVLRRGQFRQSPFINFRWLKAPGEIYGRSPVMKALPDIKTANKVVELVLKNASIAVTGIWQADDDGVLNPANIKLVPGTIIPKAVGSEGLRPLEAPGRFDVSELVLDQTRERIRSSLFVDKLGQVNAPRMTATEVLERAAEMARILGATYGRLQTELLAPLLRRGLAILARRGEIADLHVDGRLIDLTYHSALAQRQAQQDAKNALTWMNAVQSFGPEAVASINQKTAVRWLAKAFGVPDLLIADGPGGTGDLDGQGGAEAGALAGLVSQLMGGAAGAGEPGEDPGPEALAIDPAVAGMGGPK